MFVYQDDGAFALKEDHHLTKSLRFHSSGKYILKINFKNVKKKIVEKKNDFAYMGITTEIEVHISWSFIDMIHLVLKKRKR